jgi:ankyrin repeat protein
MNLTTFVLYSLIVLFVCLFFLRGMVVHASREGAGIRPHDLFAQDAGLLALAQAIERDDVAGIQQVIDRGASVNGRGRGGITPLLYAMSRQKIAAMKALVAAGADPLTDAPGLIESPLGTAAASSNPALLRAMIDAGCDPSTVTERAAPLLILAIRAGRLDNVRLLVEAGVDIDTSDVAGNSALVVAFNNLEYDLMYWMLERGADPRRSRKNIAALLTDKLGRVKPGSESEARIHSLIDLLQARGFTAATPVHWERPDWVLWRAEMRKQYGDKWSFPGWVRGKPHVPFK